MVEQFDYWEQDTLDSTTTQDRRYGHKITINKTGMYKITGTRGSLSNANQFSVYEAVSPFTKLASTTVFNNDEASLYYSFEKNVSYYIVMQSSTDATHNIHYDSTISTWSKVTNKGFFDILARVDYAPATTTWSESTNTNLAELWKLKITYIDNTYEELFDGCILYLDMNGDAKDVTNNNNDGTVSGATLTTDRFGLSNRAYSFDGTDDYVSIGTTQIAPNEGDAWSVCVWLNDTGETDYSMITDFKNNNDGIITQIVKNTSYYGYMALNIGHRTASGINAHAIYRNDNLTSYENTWKFYAFVFDGGTITNSSLYHLYIDGVSQTQTTMIRAGGNNTGNYLASDTNGTTAFLSAKYGETMFFTRGLSADEVKKSYQLTKSKYIYPYPKGVTE